MGIPAGSVYSITWTLDHTKVGETNSHQPIIKNISNITGSFWNLVTARGDIVVYDAVHDVIVPSWIDEFNLSTKTAIITIDAAPSTSTDTVYQIHVCPGYGYTDDPDTFTNSNCLIRHDLGSSASPLVDSCGNYNLTNSGGTLEQTGKIGKCVYLNGTSKTLTLPAITELTGATKWSSMILIKDGNFTASNRISVKLSAPNYEFSSQFNAGYYLPYFPCTTGGQAQATISCSTLSANDWNIIRWCYDGSGSTNDDKVKFYFNGQNVIPDAWEVGQPVASAATGGSAQLQYGGDGYASSLYFDEIQHSTDTKTSGYALTEYNTIFDSTAVVISSQALTDYTNIVVSDTFVSSAGTVLDSHIGEIGATWTHRTGQYTGTLAIDNTNRIYVNGAGNGASYYTASGAPSTANYSVEFDVTQLSTTDYYVGAVGRAATDGNFTFYLFDYNNNYGGAGVWILLRFVNGSPTVFGTLEESFGDVGSTHRIKLEMIGTSIKGYVDGVEKLSATDSGITDAGLAGVLGQGVTNNTTGIHLDNLLVTEIKEIDIDATTYQFAGPTNGTKDIVSSVFTVAPTGPYTGTITPHSTGSGTFSPTSLSWSGGDCLAKTFTYTPSNSSGSPHVISVTSSPALINPSSINYTVSPVPVQIYVNNAAIYWSKDNVYINGTSYALMLTEGSYFKTKFTGTSVAVNIDVSGFVGLSIIATRYPRIRYQTDNGIWTIEQLTSATQAITVSGLSAGTHDFRFEFVSEYMGSIGAIDRWNTPVNVIKITGLTLDEGSSLTSATILSGRMRVDGDSIAEGGRVNDSGDNVTSHDATKAFPRLLADTMGLELSQIAYGGQGWAQGGTGNVPSYPNSINNYYGTTSRLVSGTLPDTLNYWLINNGCNDGLGSNDIDSYVQTTLVSARAEAGANCRIYVVIPVDGGKRADITTNYNNYISANPTDNKTYLIDLGVGYTYDTFDTLHPSSAGHIAIANDLYNLMLMPNWISTYPKLGTVDGTNAQFLVETDLSGTAYFVVLTSGSTAPNPTQVKNGTNASNVAVPAGFSGSVTLSANVSANFIANNLTSETNYEAYVIAKTGILQDAPVKLGFTTTDITPPAFTSGYPNLVSPIGKNDAIFNVKIDDTGTSYFVVVTNNASAPSSLQVKQGKDSTGTSVAVGFSGNVAMLSGVDSSFSATNLHNNTNYDVYFVAEDEVPNLQLLPTKLDIKTKGGADYINTNFMGGSKIIDITNDGSMSFIVYIDDATNNLKVARMIIDTPICTSATIA